MGHQSEKKSSFLEVKQIRIKYQTNLFGRTLTQTTSQHSEIWVSHNLSRQLFYSQPSVSLSWFVERQVWGVRHRCVIPCFFSIVYCWNWSWHYCSFPHNWVVALQHRQNKIINNKVIKSLPLSVDGYNNKGLWLYIIIKEQVYVFFCGTRIAMLKVSQ